MKESIQAHNDYAENVLPKLKRAYLKKCQDVEVRTSHVFVRVALRSRLTHPGSQIGRSLGSISGEI